MKQEIQDRTLELIEEGEVTETNLYGLLVREFDNRDVNNFLIYWGKIYVLNYLLDNAG